MKKIIATCIANRVNDISAWAEILILLKLVRRVFLVGAFRRKHRL